MLSTNKEKSTTTIIRAIAMIVLFLTLVSSAALAQISISGNDILALKGTSRSVLVSDSIAIMVSIGPGGTAQVWDYRSLNTDTYISGALEYQDPVGGYRADQFPTANFRFRLSATIEGGTYILDNYWNVTSNQLITLGDASSFGGFQSINFTQDDVAPLPITIGTSWLASSSDTSESIGFVTITVDSNWNSVDASGTLRLPTGDFDCLRLRELSKRITVTSFNDIPFGSDTMETVSYTWLSKAHLQTFSVDSIDGGMGEVSQMISGETSTVVGSNNQPKSFTLEQNYPNPFNPSTTINYEIPTSGIVSLKVYDVLGKEIATLVNEEKPAGIYEVNFNAVNLPAGVYFYRLQTGDFVQTKKMILLK